MKSILVVDDEPNNLQVLKQILQGTYTLFFATNGKIALSVAAEKKPDLILLDIMMPGISGYEVCQSLKASDTTSHIPVIFVTAMNDTDDEARGFDVGGVDFLIKPVRSAIVLRRVKTHLDLVRAEQWHTAQKSAIFMLGEAGHYNDTDTGLHIWRMAAYAKQLALLLGWSPEKTELLELAAPMHDTGKIGIPDSILKAPRKLTDEEWIVMKTHTTIGHDILCKSEQPLFKLAAEVAKSHHERWDGEGYPEKLKGESIPMSARIVALADVFDALTMERPYKKAWDITEAISWIREGSSSQFDPAVVEKFITNIETFIQIKKDWDQRE